ncbi:hypothetical protein CAPTEDRAFT_221754 [Capitella teleta]|uniref:SMB domain-containing protein n=1 Tax=Capitella teleta TaxID=283909 RepID=R7UC51_CAPTE|nr:hypothetical protein CAPTEDRAFT_221754 [Capitella teleta]|eukprot:ELU00847.1 hypothetical protein CAPTEDRAFT_221754 [Capitella teleta]
MTSSCAMQALRKAGYLCMVLLCVCSNISTFSVTYPETDSEISWQSNEVDPSIIEDRQYFMDPHSQKEQEQEDRPEDYPEERQQEDQLVDIFKRYTRGWGHQTRFPWKRLPNRMCFRQDCRHNKECCRQYNLCDPSAHVCVDCWYGSKCRSERECCRNYPYCARTWRIDPKSSFRYIAEGKCVRKL